MYASDDGFLGYYNRSCGALPPRSVGPSLRSSSVQTWRQWQVVLVDETETEQWGYLVTYYPEEWGQARSVLFFFSLCNVLLLALVGIEAPTTDQSLPQLAVLTVLRRGNLIVYGTNP